MGQPVAHGVFEFELVAIPGLEPRHEQHPVTALAALHGVATAIPVEIAYGAHRGGLRRIDGGAPLHLLAEVRPRCATGAPRGVIEFSGCQVIRQPFPGGGLELVGSMMSALASA